ncbi:flavin reductase family protein [Amycolatopsis sp. DSM 110486]|uniref:flavin reductase family protein n=1 Tax=Amycolatopsis sp. DSM 110486 TaxID=2865832 RepID=UPI001C6A5106|nr:flavin reductase family protein [Amycolatopsis sp. DSM 110486]QYN24473.1 flavin reductase family protein [Amycolatopsis sp. DSM 110486]
MNIESAGLDAKSAYKLLIGSIIPRPIAWISTESTSGVGNLAPVSFFTCVGRKPPKVSLSIQPKSDGATLKDSFVNIRDTGEFVTNMATLPQAFALHRSATEFEPDVDEFDAVGVEKVASALVKPPRIKDAPVALECKVDQIFSAPDGLHHIVWGEVVNFYVRDDLYVNGRIDFGAIAPIGRLAAEYTVVDNAFVPPLDPTVLAERASRRMRRLDGQGEEYSAVDSPTWSASGSVQG